MMFAGPDQRQFGEVSDQFVRCFHGCFSGWVFQ
jgi:hypothetical protein